MPDRSLNSLAVDWLVMADVEDNHFRVLTSLPKEEPE